MPSAGPDSGSSHITPASAVNVRVKVVLFFVSFYAYAVLALLYK